MQNLNKNDLAGLEAQIDMLLRSVHQLRLENSSLQNKITRLDHECQHLQKKNQQAASEVNRIITQLKEEIE